MKAMPDYQTMISILVVLKLGEIQSHSPKEILLSEGNPLAMSAEDELPRFSLIHLYHLAKCCP